MLDFSWIGFNWITAGASLAIILGYVANIAVLFFSTVGSSIYGRNNPVGRLLHICFFPIPFCMLAFPIAWFIIEYVLKGSLEYVIGGKADTLSGGLTEPTTTNVQKTQ